METTGRTNADPPDAYLREDEDALDTFDCSMDADNRCELRGTAYCDMECPWAGELKQ